MNIIPNDFGLVNGTSISNIDTILKDVNKSLGKHQDDNPNIEYIITRPYGLISLPFNIGSINYNTYGHSALRYTIPIGPEKGRDVVVNIEGKEKKVFLQYYDAKNYLFSTDPNLSGTQKGVYQRDMIGLRIEKIPIEDLIRLHNYIQILIEKDKNNEIKFNILFGPLINIVTKLLHTHFNIKYVEYGNCSRWISSILFQAKVTTNIFVWPKTIFINMFENYYKTNIKNLSNMNIIYYLQPNHVNKTFYGVKTKPLFFESIAPLQSIRELFYYDLKFYSNVLVKIPNNSIKAELIVNSKPFKPSKLRNIVNNRYVIAFSVVSSILVYHYSFNYIINLNNNNNIKNNN